MFYGTEKAENVVCRESGLDSMTKGGTVKKKRRREDGSCLVAEKILVVMLCGQYGYKKRKLGLGTLLLVHSFLTNLKLLT